MTQEAAFWQQVKRRLGQRGRVVRIESGRSSPGTPDVYYNLGGRTGWLELKRSLAWPKRPSTPLIIPKLRAEQVLWIEAEAHQGGRAWVFFRVGDDYLLLPARTVRAATLKGLTRDAYFAGADLASLGRFPSSLLEALRT